MIRKTTAALPMYRKTVLLHCGRQKHTTAAMANNMKANVTISSALLPFFIRVEFVVRLVDVLKPATLRPG